MLFLVIDSAYQSSYNRLMPTSDGMIVISFHINLLVCLFI